jgi:uncharacterized Zn finger protein (UPF0148 family)
VRVPSRASRSGHLICPVCEAGELHPFGGNCERCGYIADTATLLTLEQLIALSDALGKHACECGHPEMRLLPDGVYHCPACRSEILALEDSLESERTHLGSASAWSDEAEPHQDAHTSSRVYGQWR